MATPRRLHFFKLERLCRSPVALERLKLLSDGRLLYKLKKHWKDGTSHIIFHPFELLERLAALVPAPQYNMIRYSGVLASSVLPIIRGYKSQ